MLKVMFLAIKGKHKEHYISCSNAPLQNNHSLSCSFREKHSRLNNQSFCVHLLRLVIPQSAAVLTWPESHNWEESLPFEVLGKGHGLRDLSQCNTSPGNPLSTKVHENPD